MREFIYGDLGSYQKKGQQENILTKHQNQMELLNKKANTLWKLTGSLVCYEYYLSALI